MKLGWKAWEIPLRIATGGFILNSGVSMLGKDETGARQTQSFATGAYPALARIDPSVFLRTLSAGEIALGAALLLPVVPAGLAGAGLTAFSAGLAGLYLRAPGLRRPGSLRPTDQGLSVAKDVWLLAIGVAFVVDSLDGRLRETAGQRRGGPR